MFADNFDEFLFANFARAKSIYADRNRSCNANGVSQLNLAFIRKSRCYNIFLAT